MDITFDQQNKLRSEPYEEYFGVMDLTEEQKEERISFSEKMEDVLLFIFAFIGIQKQMNTLQDNIEYTIELLKTRYEFVLKQFVDNIDEYLESYVRQFSAQTVETTLNNLEEVYMLSSDRAMYIAENEANTSLNYKDFTKAILSGKTMKKWIDKRDKRERKSHLSVGGKAIGISKPFVVGNSLLQFPKDTSLGAEAKEIVNCRCTIKYM